MVSLNSDQLDECDPLNYQYDIGDLSHSQCSSDISSIDSDENYDEYHEDMKNRKFQNYYTFEELK